MQSTRSSTVPPYLGVDLTDRHAINPRPIDVCGVRVEGDALRAEFWQWSWGPSALAVDVTEILPELRESRSVMIDGPQGFALPGRKVRECERLVRAPGRTPDDWPAPTSPYAGFVRSAIELFQALHHAHVPISSSTGAGACEVYPGDIWPRLAGRRLPKKTTKEGCLLRRQLLEQLGLVGLPERPTHDELDAAVAALLAASVDDHITGMSLTTVGEELVVGADGRLREGPMFVPCVHDEMRARLDRQVGPTHHVVECAAQDLLDEFVAAAAAGRPTVCTYKAAARRLLGRTWSQALLAEVLRLARATVPREVTGLGEVYLDTFIVNARTREPGTQHWTEAAYALEDWRRVLASAEVLA